MKLFLIIITLVLTGTHQLPAKTELPELLKQVEQSIPVAYRYPEAVVEMRELDKSEAQSELLARLSVKSFSDLDFKPLNEVQKAILFKAAQELPAKQYLQILDRAYALAKNEELNQQQFRWALFPSSKHLRDIWTEDPPSEELKAMAVKAREIMGADSGVGKFMAQVISGEIAVVNRDFAPDAKPLRQAYTPPTTKTVNPSATPEIPPPTPVPAVEPSPVPATPQARSINPVWWIVGAITVIAAAVFVARRKKPKA